MSISLCVVKSLHCKKTKVSWVLLSNRSLVEGFLWFEENQSDLSNTRTLQQGAVRAGLLFWQ